MHLRLTFTFCFAAITANLAVSFAHASEPCPKPGVLTKGVCIFTLKHGEQLEVTAEPARRVFSLWLRAPSPDDGENEREPVQVETYHFNDASITQKEAALTADSYQFHPASQSLVAHSKDTDGKALISHYILENYTLKIQKIEKIQLLNCARGDACKNPELIFEAKAKEK